MRSISLVHQALFLPLWMMGLMLVVLTACKPDDSMVNSIGVKSKVSEWQDISETGLPRVVLSGFGQDRTMAIEEIEFPLEYQDLQSQFKAQSVQQCRKHLSLPAGAKVIERKQQQLSVAYCDYVIYLNKGQVIDVSVKHPQLTAYMIRPFRHDFSNDGPVQAVADDRYIFRVKYVGVEYQTQPINYNLTVTIR